MDAFAIAMGAIFADPNMAVAATYRSGQNGEQAIRVLFRAPDEVMRFGESPIMTDTQVAELLGSDISAPMEGDTVQVGSEIYMVRGEPRRDQLRMVWTVDLVPVP